MFPFLLQGLHYLWGRFEIAPLLLAAREPSDRRISPQASITRPPILVIPPTRVKGYSKGTDLKYRTSILVVTIQRSS